MASSAWRRISMPLSLHRRVSLPCLRALAYWTQCGRIRLPLTFLAISTLRRARLPAPRCIWPNSRETLTNNIAGFSDSVQKIEP
jgi:hypothetical protein